VLLFQFGQLLLHYLLVLLLHFLQSGLKRSTALFGCRQSFTLVTGQSTELRYGRPQSLLLLLGMPSSCFRVGCLRCRLPKRSLQFRHFLCGSPRSPLCLGFVPLGGGFHGSGDCVLYGSCLVSLGHLSRLHASAV
jgi:hypothetical protein